MIPMDLPKGNKDVGKSNDKLEKTEVKRAQVAKPGYIRNIVDQEMGIYTMDEVAVEENMVGIMEVGRKSCRQKTGRVGNKVGASY